MIRSFLRGKKLASAGIAAALVACAFQPAGCTVNIDQNLLNSLQGIVGQFIASHDGTGLGLPRPACLRDGGCQSDPSAPPGGEQEDDTQPS